MPEVSRHRPPVSSAPLAVTPAKEADIPVILSILEACRGSLPALAEDGADTLLRRNVRRGSAAVARLDGCAAGVCVWSPVLRRISLLAVLPEARGAGVASALLRDALRQLPPGDVCVETFCAGDARGRPALALYQKFGFVPDGELTGFKLPMQKLRLRRD